MCRTSPSLLHVVTIGEFILKASLDCRACRICIITSVPAWLTCSPAWVSWFCVPQWSVPHFESFKSGNHMVTAVRGGTETHDFHCIFLHFMHLKNIPSFPFQHHMAEVAVGLMKTFSLSKQDGWTILIFSKDFITPNLNPTQKRSQKEKTWERNGVAIRSM